MINGLTAPRNISAVRLIDAALGCNASAWDLRIGMNRDRVHFLRQHFARQG